jgi:hypothetical protein
MEAKRRAVDEIAAHQNRGRREAEEGSRAAAAAYSGVRIGDNSVDDPAFAGLFPK